MATPCDAVLMIAYGGPESMVEVRPFLANTLRGKRVPPQRVEEVVDHYGVIGGRSPLNDLIRDQAGRLQTALADAGLLRGCFCRSTSACGTGRPSWPIRWAKWPRRAGAGRWA
jgi:protoheme ferro-lyase